MAPGAIAITTSLPPATSNGLAKKGRIRHGSVGQREAEAHVPTLKNQGKSDCAVRIIGITEVKAGIPTEKLSNSKNGEFWKDPEINLILSNAGSTVQVSPTSSSFAIKRSRALQAKKESRRPALTMRTSSSQNVKKFHYGGPHVVANDATVRRLTSGMWAVRKEAFVGAKQDGGRLLKQIEKQILFSSRCRTGNLQYVSAPEIYGINLPGKDVAAGSIGIDMEYIPFSDAKFIMLEKDRATNEWVAETAIELVDYNFSMSKTAPLGELLPEFEKKALSIKSAMLKSKMVADNEALLVTHQIDRVLEHYRQMPSAEVPVGFCHGDLTLANMLIDPENRELCVFDFLDSFVESPLQDIAKLLQDVRHQWFLTQTTVPEDRRPRMVSLLSMYYEKVKAAYCDYALWDLVPLFEFFCLARILPYFTELKEKHCILNGLERIYNDLFGDLDSKRANELLEPRHVDLERPYSPHDRKVTVIVPALGPAMETQYASGSVKLLTLNSNGRPIIVNSIASLDTTNVSRIVVVVLNSLVETKCGSTTGFENLFDGLEACKRSKMEFIYSSTQSSDACESVTLAIHEAKITGPIFIKDADNDFKTEVMDGNYVNFTSVVREDHPANPWQQSLRPDLVDAMKKSYVSFVYDNVISNVAYGSFISSNFCCGGWSFLSAGLFLDAVNSLRDLLATSGLEHGSKRGELRVVDVLWQLVSEGHLFFGIKAEDYQDWGSNAAWLASINTRL
ncbi:hypothetical protein BT63DRAFT_440515 [Microthyrium microscopicum]|uniref:Aminoglycoside phosphotransferase domain-containing protein n=1 Tax=Microthyrium microscopicum TaxID=703497 RepID=A0A6A6UAJ6_9PEZI|nr:hypothetical protein BT63DRAFT_440515 [Microthyrium microscopicum]